MANVNNVNNDVVENENITTNVTDTADKNNTVEETTKEDELKAREQALAEREQAIKQREIELKLQEQGLNKSLLKYINFNNVNKDDLDNYIKEVKQVVQEQQGYVPKNHKDKTTQITKAQFNKMSYVDRCNLYNTNKELYMSLVK